ncbi:MAG TPA: flagellar basal-body MS-ring/collar protein FliF [Capillimicrobium sp.]|nr:flagellar basal-body MS-ring/collar protein FliF [Capillimicrobium sp.]
MKLLQSMTMRQRLTLAASVVAVLIVAFLLLRMATAPSYSLIASGLDPARTGKMTATLDAQGISYELRNNGTALAVEKSQTAQAQIALADAGLSTSGKSEDGLDKVGDLKMGSSTFQQKIAYQQGLESSIEQTLGNIEGVSSATVQLTLPEDQLFADEAKPPTAAVLIAGDATSIDEAAVRGMANLVANSVEGLKAENVTITDSTGTMLWPAGENGAGGSMSKAQAEARFAAAKEAEINAMLMRTLGADKAQVRINADLNVDETTVEQLKYDRRGNPVEESTETEELEGSGGGGNRAAGTETNVPGYAQQGGGGGGDSNYQSEKTTTKNVYGKTVTRRKVAPGAVNRLDVALLVDRSVPAAEVAELRTAVASAAGIQADRGDTLAVSQMTFAKPEDVAAPGGPLGDGGIMDYAKYVLLGLASLIFLFFLARHLRRRENEVLADPAWLRQLEAPMPIAQLEHVEDDEPLPSLVAAKNTRRMQIEEVVQKEPERIATALRTWMNEG